MTGEKLLFVCGYRRLREHVEALRPSRVVSILGKDDAQAWPLLDGVEQLQLEIDDYYTLRDGVALVTHRKIRRLAGFVREWDRERPMLMHCWAGFSRSPAALMTALAVLNPGREEAVGRMVRACAPHVTPNAFMVQMADEVLECHGRLMGALAAMGGPGGWTGEDLFGVPADLGS